MGATSVILFVIAVVILSTCFFKWRTRKVPENPAKFMPWTDGEQALYHLLKKGGGRCTSKEALKCCGSKYFLHKAIDNLGTRGVVVENVQINLGGYKGIRSSYVLKS